MAQTLGVIIPPGMLNRNRPMQRHPIRTEASTYTHRPQPADIDDHVHPIRVTVFITQQQVPQFTPEVGKVYFCRRFTSLPRKTGRRADLCLQAS